MHTSRSSLVVTFLLGIAACSGEADNEMKLPSSRPVTPVAGATVLVVNGGDASVSIIDVATRTVAATVALTNASFPHHLALRGDRAELALAIPGMDLSAGHGGMVMGGHAGMDMSSDMEDMAGAVAVLDARTGETRRAMRLSASNHNAIFSPNGQEIWTSQMMASGVVLVLNASTLEEEKRISVGPEPAEITFDRLGRYAFVANGGSDTVSVIDVESKSVVRTINVGDNPVGAWQGANGIAYVDNETAMTLTAIDTSTLEVIRTFNLGFMPGMAALGPDGRVWVTDADGGRIVRFDPTTAAQVDAASTGAGAHGIAFDGGGTNVYISNQGAGTVSVLEVASLATRATIPVGVKPNGLVWRSQ